MNIRFENSITFGTVALIGAWILSAGIFYATTTTTLAEHQKQLDDHARVLELHRVGIEDIKETLSAIKESNAMMSDWMRRIPNDPASKPKQP